MEHKKEEFSEQVNAEDAPAKRTRKSRVRNVCARYWWLFLLCLVALVLVIVLPIIYVGYPHFAQSAVNDSTLNITSMSILHPEPTSFLLSLVSVIGSKSSFKPTLDAFNGSLYLPGASSPFITIEIPAIKAQNGAESAIENQNITISNAENFAGYAGSLLQNETVTIILKGSTKLKEGSLQKVNVDYDKTITLAGFNGLANFSIENLHLNTSATGDEPNLYADVSIPNPTVQTLQLGDVALAMSVPVTNGTQNISYPVGTTTLFNATLFPGNNSIPFKALTNQTLILGLVSKNPSFLTGLPVDIQTVNCTVNGVNIPYLTDALSATVLHTKLDVSSAL